MARSKNAPLEKTTKLNTEVKQADDSKVKKKIRHSAQDNLMRRTTKAVSKDNIGDKLTRKTFLNVMRDSIGKHSGNEHRLSKKAVKMCQTDVELEALAIICDAIQTTKVHQPKSMTITGKALTHAFLLRRKIQGRRVIGYEPVV